MALEEFPSAGLRPAEFQPLTGYFNQRPIPAPEVSTVEASRAAGKAALIGSIAKVLADLPDKLISSYEKGRQMRIGGQVEKQYNQALANPGTGDLANFEATSGGVIKFSPQDAELRKLQLAAYGEKAKTPYQKMLEQVNPQLPAEPITIPSQSPETQPPTGSLSSVASPGLDTSPAALSGLLPSDEITPAGKDASKIALASLPQGQAAVDAAAALPSETIGFKKMADGTVIQTLPGGIQRAWGPGDNDWVTITKPDASKRETIAEKVDEKLALEGQDVASMTPEQKQAKLREISGGKRLTEGEQKTSIYLGRADAANNNLDAILKTFDPTSAKGAAKVKATGTLLNPMAGPEAQKLNQASLEFIAAVLRKDSGATITPQEESLANRTWIPQFGDSKEVLAQKADARKRAIQELRETLPSKSQTPAGETPAPSGEGRVVVNTQAEYDALKSGTKYVDSAGNKATKP